jgi:tetratricopeptide (TPR) repeat protein
MSINAYSTLLGSNYLYSRMGPQTQYQTHLSLSDVLLRAGIYARAEQVLYEATSLADEPHEAYRGLALIATQQNRWTEATAHWKNCLFLAPDKSTNESEYLQRLGSLLILDGSVNEGRHYLARAVAQWERDMASLPAPAPVSAGFGGVYSWMVAYLLGALGADWPLWQHGPPPGRPPNPNLSATDAANQTAPERRLLMELVNRPSILNGRAFFDLGHGLWEAGAAEAAIRHMKRGLAMTSKEAYGRSHAMRLRVALDFPWTVGSSSPEPGDLEGGFDEDEWVALEQRLDAYEGQVGLHHSNLPLSPAETAALQVQPMDMLDLVATIGVISWHGHTRVVPLLRRISRLFRLHCSALTPTSPPQAPRDVTVVRKKRKKKQKQLHIQQELQPQQRRRQAQRRGGVSYHVDVIRVGIVSALFCEHPAGKVLLAAARVLGKFGPGASSDPSHTRSAMQLTLFAFPTAVDPWSYNITSQANHYVRLRSGDWLEARRQILNHRLDCVVFADWNDAATLLLGYHRLAPLQVVLVAKGAPAGLPSADYYLVSEYHTFATDKAVLAKNNSRKTQAQNAGDDGVDQTHSHDGSFSEQMVSLDGLGVTWADFEAALRLGAPDNAFSRARLTFPPISPPRAGSVASAVDPTSKSSSQMPQPPALFSPSAPFPTAPLRYEYHGHYFFQSENIYVVPAPVQAMRRSFDLVLAKVLLKDPKGVLVFLGDPSEVPEVALESYASPSSSSPGLINPAQWYQRFVGRLLSHRLLRGDRNIGQRLRVLPRLDHAGRLDLLRIADAVLDPVPLGLTLPVLEALAVGTPVITVAGHAQRTATVTQRNGPMTTEHGFAANFLRSILATDTRGPNIGLECCVANSADSYVSAAVKLGTEPEYKLRVQRTLRRKLSAWAETSDAARATTLFDFISRAAQNNRRQQRQRQEEHPGTPKLSDQRGGEEGRGQ